MTESLPLFEVQPSAPQPTKPGSDEAAARKPEILEAIGEHLRVHGRKNWDLVRERPAFAPYVGRQAGEAGRRKFFRWVDAVVKATPEDSTRPHEARAAAEKHMAWANAVAAEAEAEHPDLGVPAAFIAKMGVDGRRRVNLEAIAHQTVEDLGRLRQEAYVKDPTAPGGERVKDVQLLESSIRSTTRFMAAYERIALSIWHTESHERFNSALLKVMIDEVPKDRMLAAMKRVKALNDKRAYIGDPDDGLRMSPDGKVTLPASPDDVPRG